MMAAQSRDTKITKRIVLMRFCRCQSELPKDCFGICGLNALLSPTFWQAVKRNHQKRA